MKKRTPANPASKRAHGPERRPGSAGTTSDKLPILNPRGPGKKSTAETDGTITLLLVDDHEMVRHGLTVLLRDAANIRIIGEAGTKADAITLATRLKPSVILMDLRLSDGSGVDACREIRDRVPQVRVLFLSSVDDEEAVLASIAAGAEGYLLKDIAGQSLIRAIETVAAGQSILAPSVTQRVLTRVRSGALPSGGQEELSRQERLVLELVTEGKTNKEIASILKLSPKTVRNYLSHVFEKLNVSRRSQAAVAFSKRYSQ